MFSQTNKAPTLLVLAAGMGSRYGGLKQLDPVGPSGETILDYSVYDAVRAGFGRVVFVIRKQFDAEFRERIGARHAKRVAVDYVFQELDFLPTGFGASPTRTKPWGTGHAVWCAREAVREPFAVINGDDNYGADAYERLANFLRGENTGVQARYAMVGYPLPSTLSEHGTVSRGVCRVSERGFLERVEEHTAIAAGADGISGKNTAGETVPLSAATTVSMNCWGFEPGFFVELDAQLRAFLAANLASEKAEFYLPSAVAECIRNGSASVSVLPTSASWMGITYREDKPRVVAATLEKIAQGIYPQSLF